jgi:hypothetical protein
VVVVLGHLEVLAAVVAVVLEVKAERAAPRVLVTAVLV